MGLGYTEHFDTFLSVSLKRTGTASWLRSGVWVACFDWVFPYIYIYIYIYFPHGRQFVDFLYLFTGLVFFASRPLPRCPDEFGSLFVAHTHFLHAMAPLAHGLLLGSAPGWLASVQFTCPLDSFRYSMEGLSPLLILTRRADVFWPCLTTLPIDTYFLNDYYYCFNISFLVPYFFSTKYLV